MRLNILCIGLIESLRHNLEAALTQEGCFLYSVESFQNAVTFIEDLDSALHAVLFAENRLGEKESLSRIVKIKEHLPDIDYLILTDTYFEDENACFALYDTGYQETLGQQFIDRHVDHIQTSASLKSLCKRAIRMARACLTLRKVNAYKDEKSNLYSVESYIGSSAAARRLKEVLLKLAGVPLSTAIITGESGTGKGHVARILHHTSTNNDGDLVEVNCAALPRELLESQLFGHEVGAFTGAQHRHKGLFEQADGGTLFLDEIGDMDLDLQAKLLKAIEDKKIRRLGGAKDISVDTTIIAATSVDLVEAIKNQAFREDLYHRLSVFQISLPTLRERKPDLLELVPLLVGEFNRKANKRVTAISDNIWELLIDYDWTGNVRELRNVIERCVLLSSSSSLSEEWLQLPHQNNAQPSLQNNLNEKLNHTSNAADNELILTIKLDGSTSLDEIERNVIEKSLKINEHNVSATAKMLGISREKLRYRIKKMELEC